MLSLPWAQVQSLVGELRSWKSCGVEKTKNKKTKKPRKKDRRRKEGIEKEKKEAGVRGGRGRETESL